MTQPALPTPPPTASAPESAQPAPRMRACLALLQTAGPRTLAGLLSQTQQALIEACLPSLRAALAPAEPEAAILILRRLSIHYPMTVRTEAEERLRWGDWLDDLADAPEDLVAAGAEAWRRSACEWFPTPGQFRAVIEPELKRRRAVLERAEDVLAHVGTPQALPPPDREEPLDLSPENRQIRAEMIAAMLRQMQPPGNA